MATEAKKATQTMGFGFSRSVEREVAEVSLLSLCLGTREGGHLPSVCQTGELCRTLPDFERSHLPRMGEMSYTLPSASEGDKTLALRCSE